MPRLHSLTQAEIPEAESEATTDNEQRHRLAQRMLAGIPDKRPEGEQGELLRITELLAHLLEFHRREEKPIWWRRFDRMNMEESELIDDPDCLEGCNAPNVSQCRSDSRLPTSIHLTVAKRLRYAQRISAYSRTTGPST